MKYDLGATVVYSGRTVKIVSRCYVGGEWLYGLRFKSGRLVDYIPHSSLKPVTA